MSYRKVKNPYPFPVEEESITIREQKENERHHHRNCSYLIVSTPLWCEECRFYDADWCVAMNKDLTEVATSEDKPKWCPLQELCDKFVALSKIGNEELEK